eukprot:TRINITY_DN45219_c0_g1_i1.p1 TRINITY_DN45219_c0_g1~~TRINITY_DN45219_c0_g1_i1.p1  ORF type:complete len:232 (+),score=69.58 TRINITY_DN45219_c0_g1_i1:47-742(+)
MPPRWLAAAAVLWAATPCGGAPATAAELADAGINCTMPTDQAAFIAAEPTCPWAKWRNDTGGPNGTNITADPRYCYECRWCPFRHSTCCERADEPAMLRQLMVSGQNDWSCFITVAWFLECGKCAPWADRYLQLGDAATLRISPDANCRSVRPCREACGYVWKQCKDSSITDAAGNNAGPLINRTLHPTEAEFCANAGDDPNTCYNTATRPPPLAASLAAAAAAAALVALV